MMRRSSDLLVVFLIAAVAVGSVALLPEGNVLRSVPTLLLVLVLPGYTLTVFAFPDGNLEMPARAAFSIGGSIAICALGGLLLHLTQQGLTVANWMNYLSCMLGILGLGAIVRRQLASDNVHIHLPQQPMHFSQIVPIGLFSTFVVIGAVSLARNGASQQPATRFTQLWLQPPTTLSADTASQRTLNVGVTNEEQQPMHYTLLLTNSGGASIQKYKISLNAGQTWQQVFVIPAYLPSHGVIRALLYVADKPNEVYRRTTFDLANSSSTRK